MNCGQIPAEGWAGTPDVGPSLQRGIRVGRTRSCWSIATRSLHNLNDVVFTTRNDRGSSAGSRLGQRLRRWPNLDPALDPRSLSGPSLDMGRQLHNLDRPAVVLLIPRRNAQAGTDSLFGHRSAVHAVKQSRINLLRAADPPWFPHIFWSC